MANESEPVLEASLCTGCEKRELITQLDQNGDGIGSMRFQVACFSDQMVPGVEQVCDGEVMKWNSSKMDSVVRSLVAIVRTRAQKTRALKHAR